MWIFEAVSEDADAEEGPAAGGGAGGGGQRHRRRHLRQAGEAARAAKLVVACTRSLFYKGQMKF